MEVGHSVQTAYHCGKSQKIDTDKDIGGKGKPPEKSRSKSRRSVPELGNIVSCSNEGCTDRDPEKHYCDQVENGKNSFGAVDGIGLFKVNVQYHSRGSKDHGNDCRDLFFLKEQDKEELGSENRRQEPHHGKAVESQGLYYIRNDGGQAAVSSGQQVVDNIDKYPG